MTDPRVPDPERRPDWTIPAVVVAVIVTIAALAYGGNWFGPNAKHEATSPPAVDNSSTGAGTGTSGTKK